MAFLPDQHHADYLLQRSRTPFGVQSWGLIRDSRCPNLKRKPPIYGGFGSG
jgi:hypothetical protein